MADYAYRFYDLLTRALIDELPAVVQSLPTRLSEAATTTASLPLGDPRIAAKGWRDATQPGRTLMVADRDGVAVWAGIVWQRTWRKSTRTAEMQLATPLSYLDLRFITADANYTAEKLAIARALLTTMQAVPGGDIGILLGAETLGYADTADYTGAQLTKVGDALSELANAEPGFDYDIACAYDDDGVPQLALRLGEPNLGRPAAGSGLVFTLPGSIIDYSETEDAQSAATRVWSVGQPTGTVDLYGSAADPSALDDGYPLIEQRQDFPTIADQVKLNAHARDAMRATRVPVINATWTTRGDPGPGHPAVGAMDLGDGALFEVSDEFYPAAADGSPGLSTAQRIIGIDIAPPQGGAEETLTLTTSRKLSSFAWVPTLARRLRNQERVARGLASR